MKLPIYDIPRSMAMWTGIQNAALTFQRWNTLDYAAKNAQVESRYTAHALHQQIELAWLAR